MDTNVDPTNVDKIILPKVIPEEVAGIFNAYANGLGKISNELMLHTTAQVERGSALLVTLSQASDPLKRMEIGQAWMLDTAKGYMGMLNRLVGIGHDTVGQIVNRH
jgi:hypothetical protein